MEEILDKKCTKCKKCKPNSSSFFSKDKSKSGGLSIYCRICSRSNERRLYKINPARRMCELAKARAKIKHVAFTISVSDIVIPKTCPYIGIPIFTGEGKSCHNSPTLDRIVPSLGYTPGNIIVVSHQANATKGDATPSQLRSIANAVEKVMKERGLSEKWVTDAA